jgi:DNA-binding transcriptional MerR regulator/methylmalonyl-CoA mutase cobalamin-binding subunit
MPKGVRASARPDEEDAGALAGSASSSSGASIRVVVNRTGIAADTLRVWERRYGFPRPARRPGGSRIYTEADVARLHLITRALDAGFRPSEVVSLPAKELDKLVEASVADAPGLPRPAGATRGRGALGVAAAAPLGPTPGVGELIAALLGDDVVALRALLRAAAVALGPRAFVTELAQPLVERVGEMWAASQLEVRHEHLASACLTAQLHLMLGSLDDGDRSPSVLLATLPGEPHVLGLDMVSVVLAASFAAPHLLGGNSPPREIAGAAQALGADVVGLSISPAASPRATTRALKALVAELPAGIELWLGGGGARAVAAAAPSARIVGAWPELDAALAAFRAR